MLMLSEAARLCDGVLSGKDTWATRVTTDSRSLKPGDLFVALQGPRFDAHDFVSHALEQGAVGAIVHNAFPLNENALIRVDNTRLALGKLAQGWRKRFDLPIVGITGSNGKTSVKEMLGSILRSHSSAEQVLVTQGNLNNDIGVPLTLLALRTHHRYAVVEMGMNHPGEIDYLTHLATPNIALVNNALRAHLGNFSSVTGIAHAKAEIFNGLTPTGIAVINEDDAHAPLFCKQATGHTLLRFGLNKGDVFARGVELTPTGSRFMVITPQGTTSINLNIPGKHNVCNALAAIAVANALHIPLTMISAGLATYEGTKGRLAYYTNHKQITIIDDSYNANPDSMKAGIDVLATAPSPRLFIMGDIGELGETAAKLHAEVGAYAQEKGIDTLLAFGEFSQNAVTAFGEGGQHFGSLHELFSWLDKHLRPHATVLVKGSRFMRMERVVEFLRDNKKEDR